MLAGAVHAERLIDDRGIDEFGFEFTDDLTHEREIPGAKRDGATRKPLGNHPIGPSTWISAQPAYEKSELIPHGFKPGNGPAQGLVCLGLGANGCRGPALRSEGCLELGRDVRAQAEVEAHDWARLGSGQGQGDPTECENRRDCGAFRPSPNDMPG